MHNTALWGAYSSNVRFVTPACDLVVSFRIQCWKHMKKYLVDHDFRADSSAVPRLVGEKNIDSREYE